MLALYVRLLCTHDLHNISVCVIINAKQNNKRKNNAQRIIKYEIARESAMLVGVFCCRHQIRKLFKLMYTFWLTVESQ